MLYFTEDIEGNIDLGITHGKRGINNGGKVLMEIFSENLSPKAEVKFFDDPTDLNYSFPGAFFGQCANVQSQISGKDCHSWDSELGRGYFLWNWVRKRNEIVTESLSSS